MKDDLSIRWQHFTTVKETFFCSRVLEMSTEVADFRSSVPQLRLDAKEYSSESSGVQEGDGLWSHSSNESYVGLQVFSTFSEILQLNLH